MQLVLRSFVGWRCGRLVRLGGLLVGLRIVGVVRRLDGLVGGCRILLVGGRRRGVGRGLAGGCQLGLESWGYRRTAEAGDSGAIATWGWGSRVGYRGVAVDKIG